MSIIVNKRHPISDREDWEDNPLGLGCLLRDQSGRVTRTVKDLGWLLKHWKDVATVYVRHPAYTEPGYRNRQEPMPMVCYMVVYMKDGSTFETPWQDPTVCRDWLKRPTFRGLPLNWYGENSTC